MILLYPPHASLKTIKHNPKASLSRLWMCTCYRSRFGFQPPLKRQGPITILSRLCWFSGSNPCSRCLLSTHLLWQPPDKQWVLKEVSHNQIFPAEQPLKRSFLSPSSGTRAIELAPGIPPLRWAMGQCFAPPRSRPPSFSQHTCTPKAHRGNRQAAPATWTAQRASKAGHIWQRRQESKQTEAEWSRQARLMALLRLFFHWQTVALIEAGEIKESVQKLSIKYLWYIVTLYVLHIWHIHSEKKNPSTFPRMAALHLNLLNLHGMLQNNKKIASINQHSWTVYLSSLLCCCRAQSRQRPGCSSALQTASFHPLWEKPINWCFRETSPPTESTNLPPLSPSSSCAPSALRAGSSIS